MIGNVCRYVSSIDDAVDDDPLVDDGEKGLRLLFMILPALPVPATLRPHTIAAPISCRSIIPIDFSITLLVILLFAFCVDVAAAAAADVDVD